MKISAVIITFNEERNISRCLDSLKGVADEVIIVDSFSKDATKEICLSYGATFIENPFQGHIEQKNFAMQKANYPYVLSLDADEALSEELKKSILEIKDNPKFDAYKFNRLTNYCNMSWIRHSGWYPDTKIRLWNKEKGLWGGINPHDTVLMQEGSSIKHLRGDLLHYSFYSISEHIAQVNKFSDIASKQYHNMGKKTSVFGILYRTSWKFLRDFVFKLGFLDGYPGYLVCKISSFATFLKYSKLRELNREKKS